MRFVVSLLVFAGAVVFALARCGEDPTGPRREHEGPKVEIKTKRPMLAVGDEARLPAAATDEEGDSIEDEIEWSSSAPEVATVDTVGVIKAVAEGETTIVAATPSARDSVPVQVTPPVLVGAGDIASCTVDGDEATAALLDSIPGIVFTVGDNVYPNATAGEFARCYDPSWGRHRGRTRPSAGNHEYHTANAEPYFNYFGVAAGEPGRGYYSYDVAGWHVIVLNTEIDASEGSWQLRWLEKDLAANDSKCTLAYFHRPLFSSNVEGGNPSVLPIWRALYKAGVELVLNGHDHYYERFAPLSPDGAPDPVRGIRQIVVGTGGQPPFPPRGRAANVEVSESTTLGVLKLTLRADGYEWEFVPVAGATFTDSGEGVCR